ncbi:MAG: hypothetical protein MUP16_06705, partial [Sedimentisphaerales bacterium]|nr:hypothetical protein [Sedimentisphaerales bacterium]
MLSITGKYIYGVINSNAEEFFDLGEIAAFEDICPFRNPIEAADGCKAPNHAYTVCFQDIAAVVSD